MKEKTNTVDSEEIERFTRLAGQWWDPRGPFAPLHRMNPLRVQYIRDLATAHFGGMASLTLLDIGCGGGLIDEPMARLGARVTGIDAGEKNIAAAKAHAQQSGLAIDYRCTTAEALLEDSGFGIQDSGKKTTSSPESRIPNPDTYDIVLALEIIEHVADVEAFVAASCALLRPGGLIVYSTLNRTAKSFALAIVGAEYVLRWLPRGTHDWHKFLKPHELANPLRRHGVEITGMTGMVFSPLNNRWQLDATDLGVNYMVAGKKSPVASRPSSE